MARTWFRLRGRPFLINAQILAKTFLGNSTKAGTDPFKTPWPTAANGAGASLQRTSISGSGNNPGSWAVTLKLDRSSLQGAAISAGTIASADMHGRAPHYAARGHIAGLTCIASRGRYEFPRSIKTASRVELPATFKSRAEGGV